MEESILITIKKMLGLEKDYDAFDLDIIIHINSALSELRQLGVGPKKGFKIIDSASVWSNFLGDDTKLEMVKEFVFAKVKPLFDPPSNSFVISMLKEEAQELAWRINVAAEGDESEETEEETDEEEEDEP